MLPGKSLRNQTVLVTRPVHQAMGLRTLIEKAGGNVVLFPTLEILPIENQESLQLRIKRIEEYDVVIFVSANAVRHAMVFWPPCYRPLRLIAIGPGTASTLEQHGLSESTTPSQFSTEGLLDLPLLKQLAGKKIAIFCGENTRPLLKETLKKRGAQVDYLCCYLRRCPRVPAERLHTLKSQSITQIVSTSKESLTHLHSIFREYDLHWLLLIPLIVISSPMVELAKVLNFSNRIVLAKNATDEAVINALHFVIQ